LLSINSKCLGKELIVEGSKLAVVASWAVASWVVAAVADTSFVVIAASLAAAYEVAS